MLKFVLRPRRFGFEEQTAAHKLVLSIKRNALKLNEVGVYTILIIVTNFLGPLHAAGPKDCKNLLMS